MGTNNLPFLGQKISELSDINDIRTSLLGQFVGRNAATGAPQADQDLGTALIPWGTMYGGALNINGTLIDFSALGITQKANTINSGAIRSTSGQPDFLRANGAAAELTVLGATTPLVLTINNTSVNIVTDLVEGSLTLAPSTNNTLLINDTTFSGQNNTKFAGEEEGSITVDTMGTEISDRVGEYVALKGTNEIMLAFVKSATELTNVFRGFFFDDTGTPIERETLSNNDTLTLMNLGWVFVENDSVTVDVIYKNPIYSAVQPGSPVLGDYWFDISSDAWKRYNGTSFVVINRTLVGYVVLDSSFAIASRAFDFEKAFKNINTFLFEFVSTTQIIDSPDRSIISVYGTEYDFFKQQITFDITTNLESGRVEAANTVYYAYITELGDIRLSDIRPYKRVDLKGYYHPYNTWRAVGEVRNDGSSDFTTETVHSYYEQENRHIKFTANGTWEKPLGLKAIKTIVTGPGGNGASNGGGGGGGGGTAIRHLLKEELPVEVIVTRGTPGVSSTFGIFATGAAGSNGNAQDGGVGANGTNGDINIFGSGGGFGISTTAGGPGGDSFWGGGAPGKANVNGTGFVGRNGGGGGGGRGANPGGEGGVGRIDVEEYFEWNII